MPMLDENVLSWATDLESNTVEQARRSAAMPFVEKPLALMADAHLGLGATVGSVIATEGAIIPAAVGVDIGCGMIAAKLDLKASQLPDSLDRIHSGIAASTPAGIPTKHDKGNGSHTDVRWMPEPIFDEIPEYLDAPKVGRQMGTLGSGNHFIELTTDDSESVWIVLHSGSRGAGNQVARRHIKRAKRLMKAYHISIDDPDLAYLVHNTDEFNSYIREMHWAQNYAAENRKVMLRLVIAVVVSTLKRDVKVLQEINCHHNYTQKEHHHGKNLWITRKGAISAKVGELGVIPGSMATGSFVVRGLGSEASYHSASHGAGRTRSRRAARRELSSESLTERMAGITWNDDPETLLDEHPEAYKDLGEVMANQADLVEPVARLTTILNFKGA